MRSVTTAEQFAGHDTLHIAMAMNRFWQTVCLLGFVVSEYLLRLALKQKINRRHCSIRDCVNAWNSRAHWLVFCTPLPSKGRFAILLSSIAFSTALCRLNGG